MWQPRKGKASPEMMHVMTVLVTSTCFALFFGGGAFVIYSWFMQGFREGNSLSMIVSTCFAIGLLYGARGYMNFASEAIRRSYKDYKHKDK